MLGLDCALCPLTRGGGGGFGGWLGGIQKIRFDG